ncbi:MAG: universal stress protein [Nitrospiraceae bacterium]|nr:universal stress protein [Nitrospiraceae bacterium]
MHIMIAVDGSEFSEWSVQMLESLASRPPELVTLLHVIDSASLKAAARKHPSASKHALAALEKAGDLSLRRLEGLARTSLAQAGTKPHTTIDQVTAHGPIAETISLQAKKRKADLLVLGSRGLSDMESYLLGSVSRKASLLAHCPVLVVKRPINKLRRVLFAADGSKYSQGACSFLCKRFLPDATPVTVLSIAEPTVTELATQYLSKEQLDQISTPQRSAAEQVVAKFRERFIGEGYEVHTEVQFDHLTDSILQVAKLTNSDLLVAGSRGLTGSERLRLGSVSETLLKYAPCSVLIVRGWRA